MAQQPTEPTLSEEKLYIGASVTNIEYHIYYKEKKGTGSVRSGYFTPITVALGYKVSERASVQMGIGYGGDRHETEWTGGTADNPVLMSAHSRTYAMALPVSGHFILFKAFRRLPVYGTASLIPALGITKSQVIENGIIVSDTKDTGMDMFATAGVGFNFKISKRFTGFMEYLFFKRNLTGKNSYYYDWNQDAPLLNRITKSLALGINYGLRKQSGTE